MKQQEKPIVAMIYDFDGTHNIEAAKTDMLAGDDTSKFSY